MEKSLIAEIVTWAFVGVFAIVALGYGVSHGFGFDIFKKSSIDEANADKKYSEEYTQPVDEISNININWKAGNVTLTYYDGDSIKITESCASELNSDTKLSIAEDDEDLTISWNDSEKLYYKKTIPTLTQKDLTVEIPNSMKLGTVKFNVNDSSVTTYGYTAESLSVDTKSDVNIQNVTADDITISGTSGQIYVYQCEADSLKANSQSGNITVSECDIEENSLKSIYGSVEQ